MVATHVKAPAALLTAEGLPVYAKLVWQLRRATPNATESTCAALAGDLGLSPHTVRKALLLLGTTKWQNAFHAGPWVPIPIDLLTDKQTGVHARLLFGLLQLTPDFRHPDGSCTYASLRSQTGLALDTLKEAILQLEAAGWLSTTQVTQKQPIMFTLENPAGPEAAAVKQRITDAQYKGEAYMREILTLLVDSPDFKDDANPDFLVNPFTNHHMQLDRYYHKHAVAFEYNGPQHYGPTDFATPEDVARQRGRDCLKTDLCHRHNIRLVVVHACDLSVERLQAKLPPNLPRNDLRGKTAIIAYLNRICRDHRAEASANPQPMLTRPIPPVEYQ